MNRILTLWGRFWSLPGWLKGGLAGGSALVLAFGAIAVLSMTSDGGPQVESRRSPAERTLTVRQVTPTPTAVPSTVVEPSPTPTTTVIVVRPSPVVVTQPPRLLASAPTPTPAPAPAPAPTPTPTAQGSPTPTPSLPPRSEILMGAGDIAWCNSLGDEATAVLLDNIPGTVFTTGDNVYDAGTTTEFNNCYD